MIGLISRCKDEYFVKEFCDYYINQGIDKLYIIDDNSNDKSIYNNITSPKVEIIYENNIIERNLAYHLYRKIKDNFEWMIYIDIDEFITTKKNNRKTIKDELQTTFKRFDCIKIPWVMMSCNGIKESPRSILEGNVHRWDHDKKHPNDIKKFRCRYDHIECKCIFKPKKFESIYDHHPLKAHDNPKIVDSVRIKKAILTPYYQNLREEDIRTGYLLCYHYRIISYDNSVNKLKNNYWYIKNGYTIEDLMSSDHSEIIDETLRNKSLQRKLNVNNCKFLHIGKCGGTYFRHIFPHLKPVHMGKPDNKSKYITMVRNPIDRFISAFYHSINIITFDISGYTKEQLINDRNTPYYKMKNVTESKLKHNHPFCANKNGIEYEELLLFFKTPNNLAEALTSENEELRKKAHKLMTIDIGHIFKSIGWYLSDINLNNIVYVGYQEKMDEAIEDVAHILDHDIKDIKKMRENKNVYDKDLSELAIRNLINFYKKDYECLERLYKKNLISEEMLNEYKSYGKVKRKIALLVCGEIRSGYEKTIENITRTIIKKYNCDCFLSTWEQVGRDKLTIENHNKDKEELVDINKLKLPNLKKYDIKKFIPYEKIDYIHPTIIKKSPKWNPIGTCYNIYHINNCLRIMEEYEKENDIKYEYVIKIRPDLIVSNKFEMIFNDQELFFSIKSSTDTTHKSDKLFYGKRDKFINFIKKVNEYKNKVWQKEMPKKFELQPIGERMFHQVIRKYNIRNRILNDVGTVIFNR